MKLGLVSDTHGYFDPQLSLLLDGVDEILHSGDVGSRVVLDELRGIAPVQAVRGNVDSLTLELPPTLTHTYGGVTIHMLHELPEPPSDVGKWARQVTLKGQSAERCRRFLKSFPAECRMVMFGHTHQPFAAILGGKLFFNPGSAGKRRFSLPRCCGLLEFSPKGVHATFLGLERYNQDLPEGVWLPMGGQRDGKTA